MGRRAFEKDQYELLLGHFRKHPGDWHGAAKVAGCDWRTARKAWTGGLDPAVYPFVVKAIQLMLIDEDKARASAIADSEAKVRAAALAKAEKEQRLAVEAEQVNGQILQLARGDVLAGLAGMARMAEGITKLAERVGEALKTGKDSQGNPLPDINPAEALKIMQRFGQTTKSLVDAAEALVAIERVRANLPSVIVGVTGVEITLEQADERLELARRAMEKAKKLGLIVHQGGAGAESTG